MKMFAIVHTEKEPSQKCWASFKSIQTIYPDSTQVCRNDNIYAAKNEMLDLAQKNGVKYLFLIEDCIIIKSIPVFNYYIDLLEKFDISLALYSFAGSYNRVLDKKPNPGVILDTDIGQLIFGKHQCDKMMCLDMEKIGSERYDLSYSVALCKEEFTNRLKTKGLLPFNGFFFDVPESWKYFEDDEKSMSIQVPKNFQQLIATDNELLKKNGVNLNIDRNVDALVNWVKEKIKEKV